MKRVKLISTTNPQKLPVGTLGSVVWGKLSSDIPVRVKFDNGIEVVVYRDEIKEVEK